MDEAARNSDVAALDEILQILFWLRGEGLGADADPSDLARLSGLAEPRIARVMERLMALGFVRAVPPGRYALTEAGVREGGRRFADEFADLTKPGHGECHDADCDCHTNPTRPAQCRGSRGRAGGH